MPTTGRQTSGCEQEYPPARIALPVSLLWLGAARTAAVPPPSPPTEGHRGFPQRRDRPMSRLLRGSSWPFGTTLHLYRRRLAETNDSEDMRGRRNYQRA